MNEFSPGEFVSKAKRDLPMAGPDAATQTVEMDAGKLFGRYRITFVVSMNPRTGMRRWFWVMEKGERLEARIRLDNLPPRTSRPFDGESAALWNARAAILDALRYIGLD